MTTGSYSLRGECKNRGQSPIYVFNNAMLFFMFQLIHVITRIAFVVIKTHIRMV